MTDVNAQGASDDTYDVNAPAEPAPNQGDTDFQAFSDKDMEDVGKKSASSDDGAPSATEQELKKSDFVPPDQGGSEFKEDEEGDEKEGAYKPDLKFNVQGKQHEFDEMFKPLITSKEAEDKIRDLYTKAYGLDASKAYNQQLIESFQEKSKEYESQIGEYTKVKDDITFMKELFAKGDYLGYARAVGLSDEILDKLATQALSYRKMDPYQREAYDQSLRSRRDVYMKSKTERELEMRLKEQEDRINQINAQQMLATIDATLEKPDYSSIAQEFDSRVGEKGSFRREIVYMGDRLEQEGKPAELGNIIQALAKRYNLAGSVDGKSSKAAVSNTVVAKEKVAQRPQSIPNVKGGASGPVRKEVTSIRDLKKMAASKGLFTG